MNFTTDRLPAGLAPDRFVRAISSQSDRTLHKPTAYDAGMSAREPEPWQTNEARPFLTLEQPRGTVSVSALGDDRFQINAPEGQHVLEGFPDARERAHTLARELG